MPNWIDNPPPPSVLSSQNEQRLTAIRKLTDRLTFMAVVCVVLAVIAGVVAGVVSAGSDQGAQLFLALLDGGAALLFGIFLYSIIRLVCQVVLFVCEHLAGL